MRLAQIKILILIFLLLQSVFIPVHESRSEAPASETASQEAKKCACEPSGFEIYKPTYGIMEYKSNEIDKFGFVKFQINLSKTIVAGEPAGIPVELGAAYTFKALWDITADSAPFEDISHNPEIFLTFYKQRQLKLRLGIEHESNGKDKAASRSWNRAYIEPRYLLKIPEKTLGFHTLGLYLKGWYKLDDSKKNKNITDFYGYGELALKLYGEKQNLFLTHYRGRKLEFGTTILEYMYNLKYGWAVYLQYFDGYGEILLDYNKRSRNLGAGFALLYF